MAANLVLHYKGLIQLHPVPRAHFRDMLSFILKVNGPMLEGDSLLWVNSPDEAVCVSKPLPDFMVWLVHTSPVKRLVVSLPRVSAENREALTRHDRGSSSGREAALRQDLSRVPTLSCFTRRSSLSGPWQCWCRSASYSYAI